MIPSDPIAAVTHADPYPYYANLVTHSPIYRDDTLKLWVAAGADAVVAVLSNERCRVRPASEPVPQVLLGSPAGDIFGALVRMNDGASHCPLKHAVSAACNSLELSEASTRSRVWVNQLVDELRPHIDRSRLTEIILRLPVYVVADLLGVPHDRMAQITHWLSEFVGCLAPTRSADQLEHGKLAADRLFAAVQALLVAQPSGCANTLLASLATEARRVGRDDPSIVANAIGLMSQAYEATAGLLGTTLITLAKQPDLRALVMDDPDLLEHIILEVLRYDPPIQNTRRFLSEASVVADQAMQANDVILVLLAAANRDPTANPNPERFDPFRKERHSFTFGLGQHACPGAGLAVTIAQAGAAALIASDLDISLLADTVSYRPSVNARIPLWQEVTQ